MPPQASDAYVCLHLLVTAYESGPFVRRQGALRSGPVRWERLFDELEAAAADGDRLDHVAEVADRTRRERARIHLADRLLGAEGDSVELRVVGAGTVRGPVRRVGGQWVLLGARNGSRNEVLVPVSAILTASGVGRRAVTRPSSSVASRLGLGHVLREMSRDRSIVHLVLVDGHQITGMIDGVGADHLDVVPRMPGEPLVDGARSAAVIAFRALATVSRAV